MSSSRTDGDKARFDAPWQLRIHAAAAALERAGVLDRERFRAAFEAQLASAGVRSEAEDRDAYFRCWLAALERSLAATGKLSPSDVDAAVARLAGGPPAGKH